MEIHLEIYEQNIDKEIIEDIRLTGNMEFPALIVRFEKPLPPTSESRFNIFKNSNKLSGGNTALYFMLKSDDKWVTVRAGDDRIDYGIDIVFSIENIFADYIPSTYHMDESREVTKIASQDLLGTIIL